MWLQKEVVPENQVSKPDWGQTQRTKTQAESFELLSWVSCSQKTAQLLKLVTVLNMQEMVERSQA